VLKAYADVDKASKDTRVQYAGAMEMGSEAAVATLLGVGTSRGESKIEDNTAEANRHLAAIRTGMDKVARQSETAPAVWSMGGG
jgi:hypothetical protein